MMRSMFSGVSSLRVHQTRMDVIANNIANVNTVGFKSQRATFQDAFYQMLQNAAGPDPVLGRAGTDPRQVGLGLALGSIDNIMTQGASQRTDNPLDVMIQGPGFFIVDTPNGRAFTRAGNINLDREMNLHINGMKLMGWTAEEREGEFVVSRGELANLNLSRVQTMRPQPTSIVEIVGNLNIEGVFLPPDLIPNPYYDPDAPAPPYNLPMLTYARTASDPIPRTLTIIDSLGTSWTIDIEFRYHARPSSAGESHLSFWTFEMKTDDDGNVLAWRNNERTYHDGTTALTNRAALNIEFPLAGPRDVAGDTPEANPNSAVGTLIFDNRGNFYAFGPLGPAMDDLDPPIVFADPPHHPNTGLGIQAGTDPGSFERDLPMIFNITPVDNVNPSAFFGLYNPLATPDPAGAVEGAITINLRGFTANAGSLNLRTSRVNGNEQGRLTDISVAADGSIMGRFSNGLTRVIGIIPIALFDNPAGLERGGANLWFETVNSGFFDGSGTVGQMIGGALEMSNVDLANEFTDMITTQRGFQAASRTISVSDEMLQELVNLRR